MYRANQRIQKRDALLKFKGRKVQVIIMNIIGAGIVMLSSFDGCSSSIST